MAEYDLLFTGVYDFSTKVEADSVEQAINETYQERLLPPTLCPSCSGAGEAWTITLNPEPEFAEARLDAQVVDSAQSLIQQYVETAHNVLQANERLRAELAQARRRIAQLEEH